MTKLTKKVLAVLLALTAFCGVLPLTVSALPTEEEFRQQLTDLIAEAEAVEDVGYTAQSWGAFAAALYDAKRVLDSPTASTAEIERNINSLQGTMNALTLKPAEKTGFEKFIDILLRPFYLLIFLIGALFA